MQFALILKISTISDFYRKNKEIMKMNNLLFWHWILVYIQPNSMKYGTFICGVLIQCRDQIRAGQVFAVSEIKQVS